MNKGIELCTFSDDDKNYCKSFIVDREWLMNILESLDMMNNRQGVSLERFLDNYVWDETYFIYQQAKKNKKIIFEKEVK